MRVDKKLFSVNPAFTFDVIEQSAIDIQKLFLEGTMPPAKLLIKLLKVFSYLELKGRHFVRICCDRFYQCRLSALLHYQQGCFLLEKVEDDKLSLFDKVGEQLPINSIELVSVNTLMILMLHSSESF